MFARTRLRQTVQLHSELPPDELHERFVDVVEPHDGDIALIAKLSGAGIVARVVNAPVTTRPFFGTLRGRQFEISQATRGREVTPFQPIVRGTIRPTGFGSTVEIRLRPHSSARTFELPARIFAVLLVAVSIPALLSGTAIAAIALVFAALFWTFPGARARAAFTQDCTRAITALEAATPLTRNAPETISPGDSAESLRRN